MDKARSTVKGTDDFHYTIWMIYLQQISDRHKMCPRQIPERNV